MYISYLGLRVFTIVNRLCSHAPSYYLMIAYSIQTFLLLHNDNNNNDNNNNNYNNSNDNNNNNSNNNNNNNHNNI